VTPPVGFVRDDFPRSSRYDPDWLLSLDMGPHPLWLLEDLAADLVIEPGARVLDLGSGKGATSVFLAREYDVEVWAADLWVPAEVAEATFRDAGVSDRVHAVHADARHLPFPPSHFDLVVSIDSWEYFGTDDHFLPSLASFIKPGGQLGVATPAIVTDVRDLGEIPAHIRELIGWEALAWHPPEWWRRQWELTGLFVVTAARLQPSGWHDWLLWAKALVERGEPSAQGTVDMLEADGGRLLSFALVAGRRL
jgi:SAM-dependent methyltransferase